MQGEQTKMSFRNYTFRAGPLAGKRLRDITDKQLDWALRYNADYIRTYTDPLAVARFRRKMYTVARLPAGVAERRAGLAREALTACQKEYEHRLAQDAELQIDLEDMSQPTYPRGDKPPEAVYDLVELARQRSIVVATDRLRTIADRLQQLQIEVSDVYHSLQAASKSPLDMP